MIYSVDVGDCTSRMMQLFTSATCRKRFRDHPVQGNQPECEPDAADVFSVEVSV
jgi:hypothetical protein